MQNCCPKTNRYHEGNLGPQLTIGDDGLHTQWVDTKTEWKCVISGFRHEVDENCTLLGFYAACSGNSLSTSRIQILDS